MKINDRNITILRNLTILLIAFISFGQVTTTAGDRIVSVGVYENPPKVFTDNSGKPAGIFIDLIKAISQNQSWNLNFIHGSWSQGLDRLKNGEIDVMPDVAYSAERENLFAFHKEPVLSDWFQVYARKGSGIRSIVDLAGKRVVVLERSMQQASFERLTNEFAFDCKLIALPDYNTMFQLVSDQGADAAITNRFYGLTHAKEYNLTDTAIIFNPTKLFFAFSKSVDSTMLNAIDAQMIRMKERPQSIYYQSLRRWTSEKVQFTLPVWIKVIGMFTATALFMSIMGVFVLKSQVNKRTSELQKINREMEVRIIQRTSELADAMEKAKAADHLKSAFLATMSHELRTPLNAIIGFTGILLQELAGPLNEEQHKQLSMVKNSSGHLLKLINDVLDISKIEAGQLQLSLSSFKLKKSVENMARLILPLAKKKGLELKFSIALIHHQKNKKPRCA